MILTTVALLMMLAASADRTDRCNANVCTVGEMLEHVLDWDDRTVLVHGWLSGCHHGFHCVLATHDPRDGAEGNDAILDYVERVEPALGALDGSEIVLRARVTDECSGENICTDRASVLVPVRVVRVITRPVAQGAETVPLVPFRSVWEDVWAYDGVRIRVTGWLDECTRERCILYPGADQRPSGIVIKIGRSASFDRAAARLRSRWVTVEGTIQARCFNDGYVIHDSEGNTLLLLRCPGRSEQFRRPNIVDRNPAPANY